MGTLTETSQWENTINQIETGDEALGGTDGVVNTAPRQLANRTQYLKNGLDAIKAIKTATITTTWTGSSAPYTQTIAVSGITASDEPIIYPIYNANNAAAILERAAWGLIGTITTAADSIICTCFETAPITAINIHIKVI